MDAECSHIRGGPMRTRLRLVKSTAGRAGFAPSFSVLILDWISSLNAVRPLCYSSGGIYFISLLNHERGELCAD